MALQQRPSLARAWSAPAASRDLATSADSSAEVVAAPTRVSFIGVPIDCLSGVGTVAVIDSAVRTRSLLRHSCLNVAKFVAARRNSDLAQDLNSSDIVSVDGMGIVWGARLLGIHVPERVTGIDLMDRVLQLCARKGYRPYFLGAHPDVVARAVANMQAQHSGLVFAGWRDGYFEADEEAKVVADIRAARADCLFIGMPTPYKERFLARNSAALGVPFVMGVGGSFDVLAGKVKRAPRLLQNMGLEWLFRAVQEPLRLGPRYITTNSAFAVILLRAYLAMRFGSRRTEPKAH